MKDRRKYKNPPLVEAVFELFFESSNWTVATPGIFYSLIKDKYPIIMQAPGGFGISIGAKGVQIGSGNNNLNQFKSADEASIIQLSNNLLTVNKLPEYGGWEIYKEMILEAIKYLYEVLDITKVNRIGLKAINKIDIKEQSSNAFIKYFELYPALPKRFRADYKALQMSYEVPVDKDDELLSIVLVSLVKEEGYIAPTLFQLYVTRINDVDIATIDPWLESAHNLLTTTFNDSLTAYCKSAFDNE